MEIGPYDRPIVPRSEGEIKYLDYFSADELRQKKAPGREPEEVVELDYVMRGERIGDVVDVVIDTFDMGRPLSTTGEIIENFRLKKTQPSYADVFDVLRYHKK